MVQAGRPPEQARKLNEGLGSAEERWGDLLRASALAAEHGLVLYLATQLLERGAPSDSEVRGLLGLVEDAAAYREVECGGRGVEVRQPHAVQPAALDLVDALLLASQLRREVEESERLGGGGGELMLSLESLKELAKRVGLSRAAGAILDKELSEIERLALLAERVGAGLEQPRVYSSLINLSSSPLKEVLELERGEEEGKAAKLLEKLDKECRGGGCPCKPDKRNFLAHAGLERNVTAVLASGGKIYVGYRRECLEELANLVAKI
jgi:CRISPR-associated protein Csx1